MASLLGQKDLSVGEGRGSEGEKHPTKTLCLTLLNTSNTTLFYLTHSLLVGFNTRSNNFIQSRFIFSCRNFEFHAASLALQFRFIKANLLYLCLQSLQKVRTFTFCCGYCCVGDVTVACSVCTGHHPVKEALYPVLRPALTVDLHAEECLLGWL